MWVNVMNADHFAVGYYKHWQTAVLQGAVWGGGGSADYLCIQSWEPWNIRILNPQRAFLISTCARVSVKVISAGDPYCLPVLLWYWKHASNPSTAPPCGLPSSVGKLSANRTTGSCSCDDTFTVHTGMHDITDPDTPSLVRPLEKTNWRQVPLKEGSAKLHTCF